MNTTKEQLERIIKEEIEIVLNKVNPAAQAIRDDIAAHQDVASTRARSGREIAAALGYGETEKSDPLGDLDPELTKELIGLARYRMGAAERAHGEGNWRAEGDPWQIRNAFKNNLESQNNLILNDAQVKAIFHMAGWPDD